MYAHLPSTWLELGVLIGKRMSVYTKKNEKKVENYASRLLVVRYLRFARFFCRSSKAFVFFFLVCVFF